MRPNPGICPDEARGKRVRVKLRNGYGFEAPADDRRGAPLDWKLSGSVFDVLEYEVI